MSYSHEAKAYSQFPPGFRFHPTDDELVSYYLTQKNLDSTFSGSAIAEASLNKCEPWDLAGEQEFITTCAAKAKIGEKEWYFFGLKDRKYPTGLRVNRATESGYWKTSGKDREVFSSRSSALVGMKKTLVFYKGRAPKGEKTNWVMHEYRLQGKFSDNPQCKNCKDEWVVCRIFDKSAGGKKSSIGLMRRNSFLDQPGPPSLSSLLESPCKTTAANDLETRSSESDSRTFAKAHDVPCFSTPMELEVNLTGHHLHQFQHGSSSNYPDSSDQLSVKDKPMKQSDTRISMNMMSAAALLSVSNIRRDQTLLSMPSAALDQEPGIQHLPVSPPPILCNPPMTLPSSSSNLGFSTDAYFSALYFSNSVSKASVGQYAGSLIGPFSSSFVQHKTLSNNITMGANSSVNSFLWANDGISQNILAQETNGVTCLSANITDETASVVCNRLDRPLDQLDSSVTPPVDFDSLWNIREHLV